MNKKHNKKAMAKAKDATALTNAKSSSNKKAFTSSNEPVPRKKTNWWGNS